MCTNKLCSQKIHCKNKSNNELLTHALPKMKYDSTKAFGAVQLHVYLQNIKKTYSTPQGS